MPLAIPPTGLPAGTPTIFDTGGDATNGYYIRYSSGLMEVYGSKSTGAMSTAVGSSFTSASAVAVTFPQTFTAAPLVYVSLVNTIAGSCAADSVTVTGFSGRPFSNTTGQTGTFNYRAIGNWF